MYIRSREDALENLAEILDLPDRRDQIIQSTIRIMLCLEVEPRLFLADCQALLIEGGLETLRARRREAVEAAEDLPIVVEDPEEDRLFEEVASTLDALRFTDAIRQVFPGIRAERWQIARAMLLYESGIREQVSAAVKCRGDAACIAAAREAVERLVAALRPAWSDRIGAIRTACLEALKRWSRLIPTASTRRPRRCSSCSRRRTGGRPSSSRRSTPARRRSTRRSPGSATSPPRPASSRKSPPPLPARSKTSPEKTYRLISNEKTTSSFSRLDFYIS